MTTTEQTRGEDGKFIAPVIPEKGLDQKDAKALEIKDDDGETPLQPVFEHPRIEMMKKAREKRAKDHDIEVVGDAFKAGKPDTTPADFKEAEPEPGSEKAEEIAAEKEKPADKKAEEEIPAHVATLADTDIVEIKVNGETVKMPWGEAKKRLQLSTATEQTLEEAKQEKATYKALRKTAEEEKGEKPAAAAKEDKPGEPSLDDKIAKAKADKDAAFDEWEKQVRYGDEAEIATAKKALRDRESELETLRDDRTQAIVAAAAPKPGQDPLLAREIAETQRATDAYAKAFEEDQKDRLFRAAAAMNMRDELIADLKELAPLTDREDVGKLLAKLPDRELGQHHQLARSKGLVRTLDKVFNAAGTKAREELKSRSAPAQGKQNPRDQRQAAKEGAPSQPNPASGRVPEAEDGPKPKTSKDIMAETRARRGK